MGKAKCVTKQKKKGSTELQGIADNWFFHNKLFALLN